MQNQQRAKRSIYVGQSEGMVLFALAESEVAFRNIFAGEGVSLGIRDREPIAVANLSEESDDGVLCAFLTRAGRRQL